MQHLKTANDTGSVVEKEDSLHRAQVTLSLMPIIKKRVEMGSLNSHAQFFDSSSGFLRLEI